MARGFLALSEVDLTVVVNVGDDQETHGLHVSPDLDTMVYTLAGKEGPLGWGRADDTFNLNDELARFGVDNTFQMGDRDLALKIFRTNQLAAGRPLSSITRGVCESFAIDCEILPATDGRLRTLVGIQGGHWLTFQEYFVHRGHRDTVTGVRFEGAEDAQPAEGVINAITRADSVVIAPSNPPLSIWPILAIGPVRAALQERSDVVAVSPLVGGKAIKGPAAEILRDLGFPYGNQGVAQSYQGLVSRLVVHDGDPDDAAVEGVDVQATNTLISDPDRAAGLARVILGA